MILQFHFTFLLLILLHRTDSQTTSPNYNQNIVPISREADVRVLRNCEESKDHYATDDNKLIRSIRSPQIWTGSGIGNEFELFEKETHKSFTTAMEDLPNILEAMEFFENFREGRPAYDCSDYVPNWMREAIGVGGKWKLPNNTKMSNNTRRLLQNPVYAKTLRGTVISCLHDRLREMNVSRDIPPLRNPFGPLSVHVTFGLNKLVSLSFDGELVVKATLILKWKDRAWRWKTITRFDQILTKRNYSKLTNTYEYISCVIRLFES